MRSKLLGYPEHLIYRTLTNQAHKLSESEIHALVSAEDFDEVLTLIKGSKYSIYIKNQSTVEGILTNIQRSVKKTTLAYLRKKSILDPLSISSPLRLMLAKEIELENLIRISSAIRLNWNPNRILSFLI